MEIRDRVWCRRCGDRRLNSDVDYRFGMCRSCRLEPIIAPKSPRSSTAVNVEVGIQESTRRILRDIAAIDDAGEPAGWAATVVCSLAAVGWLAIGAVVLRWLGVWR